MKRLARGAGKVIGKVVRPFGRVSNLVKVLGGVIVFGGASVLGGCGMGAYAKDPRAGYMWDSIAQGVLQAEVAREGRSEVNVYNNPQRQKSQAEMFFERKGINIDDIPEYRGKSQAEISIERSGGH